MLVPPLAPSLPRAPTLVEAESAAGGAFGGVLERRFNQRLNCFFGWHFGWLEADPIVSGELFSWPGITLGGKNCLDGIHNLAAPLKPLCAPYPCLSTMTLTISPIFWICGFFELLIASISRCRLLLSAEDQSENLPVRRRRCRRPRLWRDSFRPRRSRDLRHSGTNREWRQRSRLPSVPADPFVLPAIGLSSPGKTAQSPPGCVLTVWWTNCR